MAKGIKVLSAKPGGKIRRRILKETLEQRKSKILKELKLNPNWENLKLQVKIQAYASGI